MSGRALVAASLAVAIALVAAYWAAGGGSYEPTPVADPCAPREWRDPEGVDETAQQFALSALDGAACELGVSRERLAIALASETGRERFAAEQGIDDAELERAVRAGLQRAIDDAEAAGALDATVAEALRALADRLPVDQAVAAIANAAEFISGARDSLGGLLERAQGLLP